MIKSYRYHSHVCTHSIARLYEPYAFPITVPLRPSATTGSALPPVSSSESSIISELIGAFLWADGGGGD